MPVKVSISKSSILNASTNRATMMNVINKFLSRGVQSELAKMAKDLIYKRVKSGKGVTSDTSPIANPKPFKKLSPSYKKQRRSGRLLKEGKHFSPTKSNLTLSGQLLEALDIKYMAKGFKIEIAAGVRSPVWKNTKSRRLSNRTLAEYVSEDRPFLNLTKSEKRVILMEAKKQVREIARSVYRKYK